MEYLSTKQVAARYGLNVCTIWRWLKAGAFPAPVYLPTELTMGWAQDKSELNDEAVASLRHWAMGHYGQSSTSNGWVLTLPTPPKAQSAMLRAPGFCGKIVDYGEPGTFKGTGAKIMTQPPRKKLSLFNKLTQSQPKKIVPQEGPPKAGPATVMPTGYREGRG